MSQRFFRSPSRISFSTDMRSPGYCLTRIRYCRKFCLTHSSTVSGTYFFRMPSQIVCPPPAVRIVKSGSGHAIDMGAGGAAVMAMGSRGFTLVYLVVYSGGAGLQGPSHLPCCQMILCTGVDFRIAVCCSQLLNRQRQR